MALPVFAIEEIHTNLCPTLKEVAQTDPNQFVDLVEATNWAMHTPEEILTAIDVALCIEMSDMAINLAQQVGHLFPNHDKCQRAAQVIAPPKIIGTHPPQGKKLAESADCIRKHAREYRGQWVAAREGVFLGAAPTLKELKVLIGYTQDSDSVLFTKILPV